jgi:hypothetical protein
MKTIYLTAWILNAILLDILVWTPDLGILFIFNTIIPIFLLVVRIAILEQNAEEDSIV